MTVRQLDDAHAALLRSAQYTYAAVGRTASEPPAGFNSFVRSVTLARRDFDDATHDLLTWRLHERAGLQVWASDTPLRTGSVASMRLGVGPMSLRIPCRVVYVVDEPNRRGFAYGTLPGHPASGEESFVLRRLESGSLELTVSAFSRPASKLVKLGGPFARRTQDIITGRYLRALDRL